MGKSLVIVESPAKAKTVNHYLGEDYIVKASMGHVRDLPKKKLGVDVQADFQPTYEIIPDKKKTVAELRKAAKSSDRVILAADPDREGEAISWHLSQIIGEDNPNICRATFHEITKEGVEDAFKHLGKLDENLIQAQQTRRILDRLVGYLISPLLWKKIGKGLSAGRVQSVALRLICEREKEIKAFQPEEYWTIAAQLEAAEPPAFRALLAKVDGKKAKVANGDAAGAITAICEKNPFVLDGIKIQEKKRQPGPPYITSTLQQDGFRLHHYPVKKTMFIAQKLYEGLELGALGQTGLITYMRTDSFRVSDQARAAARKYIEQAYSPAHVPAKPHAFKNPKKSQDAHEAIRPSHLDLPPDKVKPFLKKEEYDLYKMIWNRFLASQMASAVIEETEFDISVRGWAEAPAKAEVQAPDAIETSGAPAEHVYNFKTKGEVVKFDGFLAAYPNGNGEKELLPKAKEGETLKLLGLESKQKFTEPPPRYTEGTLVKELEARGIGRPSTYAPIITTLQDRTYVVRDKGKFIPTELGMYVTDFLVKYFAELLDYAFTAHMEEELDQIGDGERTWLESLREYYVLLDKYLKEAQQSEGIKKTGIPIDEKCPKCGQPLTIKDGRFGRFKACSGYPACNFRESLNKKESKPLDEKCPKCGSQLVQKFGRFGPFVACSDYPKCKYIKKENAETGIDCPTGCGGKILRRKTRRGKIFYGCSNYPKCHFATWDEPVNKPCPACGQKFLLKKHVMRGDPYLHCWNEKCAFKEVLPAEKIWDKAKKDDPNPDPGTDEQGAH
ncbi:MAG: type I DNA topoisomerase [Acidobacteriota bacterium]